MLPFSYKYDAIGNSTASRNLRMMVTKDIL